RDPDAQALPWRGAGPSTLVQVRVGPTGAGGARLDGARRAIFRRWRGLLGLHHHARAMDRDGQDARPAAFRGGPRSGDADNDPGGQGWRGMTIPLIMRKEI